MNIHIFSCRVFTRELCHFISKSKNVVDVTFLPQGLHESPQTLKAELNAAIQKFHDQVESWQRRRKPDYLALSFGLCSESIVGVKAIDIPIVVPRVDDCIGVYLGSEKRYMECFEKYKGTYWAFPSWVESTPSTDDDYLDIMRAKYMERHDDEDMVDTLMEFEEQMMSHYQNVGFITSPLDIDPEASLAHAQHYADTHGWNLVELEGDLSLMQRLVDGPWDEEDFLIVPPGYEIEATHDISKVRAVPSKE